MTLTDAIGHGGAEGVAVKLAMSVDPRRFRRSLCVTRPPTRSGRAPTEINERRLREAGVEVLSLQRSGRTDLASWMPLVRFLRDQDVDIIHAHKFGSNVWGTVVGRMLRLPIVIGHEHTWSFEGHAVRRVVDRHVVAAHCDAIIAVSALDRQRMIETVGMPREKVVLIPNGITWEGSGDRDVVRAELGYGERTSLLVLIAVLRPQKAIPVMLEAMARLRRAHPEVRLLVAGPGDLGQMDANAASAGVDDIVRFIGPRDDVPALLAAADVGVLSSDYEGSPLTILEYMAAGLPVVATSVGGVPEIVEDGVTGILVPRRDPTALATALAQVLDHPEEARAMGARGRVRQRERFSDAAMVATVSDLYDRLLALKQRGRGLCDA
jgi:glycosyltransferase involved in cell wall biosynthesis